MSCLFGHFGLKNIAAQRDHVAEAYWTAVSQPLVIDGHGPPAAQAEEWIQSRLLFLNLIITSLAVYLTGLAAVLTAKSFLLLVSVSIGLILNAIWMLNPDVDFQRPDDEIWLVSRATLDLLICVVLLFFTFQLWFIRYTRKEIQKARQERSAAADHRVHYDPDLENNRFDRSRPRTRTTYTRPRLNGHVTTYTRPTEYTTPNSRLNSSVGMGLNKSETSLVTVPILKTEPSRTGPRVERYTRRDSSEDLTPSLPSYRTHMTSSRTQISDRGNQEPRQQQRRQQQNPGLIQMFRSGSGWSLTGKRTDRSKSRSRSSSRSASPSKRNNH